MTLKPYISLINTFMRDQTNVTNFTRSGMSTHSSLTYNHFLQISHLPLYIQIKTCREYPVFDCKQYSSLSLSSLFQSSEKTTHVNEFS